MPPCKFCDIASRQAPAALVFEDSSTLAFLDHRPLFPGHILLIPHRHIGNLAELPDELSAVLFRNARLLALAVETALGAQGAFVALNNKVSQSVPHLHIHIVPRTKGDGLRGFFWPRTRYQDEGHLERTRGLLSGAVERLRNPA
ncbi:MAG: HIT family protein [Bryobacterales bacterium]|nr:HIT family protein [Bryobacterales bacterium]